MKAIAVYPGQKNSVHLEEIRKPEVTDIPHDKGVLVKVLKVGVDATDREINDALYGQAPPGDKHMVLGHESFGVVQAVGQEGRDALLGVLRPDRLQEPPPGSDVAGGSGDLNAVVER